MPRCPYRIELFFHALARIPPDVRLINVAARLLEVDWERRARA